MIITLFGVRGTSPVIGPEYKEYGGETTSVLVEGAEGEIVVIDAGTGLRKIGERLLSQNVEPSLLLLMTHYHLDHVAGLPSFSPLYNGDWRITAVAPIMDGRSVDEVLDRVFAEPFWPLQVDTLPARLDFATLSRDIPGSLFKCGGLEIRWRLLHHPGGATAYRIDDPITGGSFVFATDVEWEESSTEERETFLRLCGEPSPPDLLVFDGQFSRENYDKFRGWGHSAWQTAVEVSRKVNAKQLLITHHDPKSNDVVLNEIEKKLKDLQPKANLARDGMKFVL
ncbi:MAG TPA: MBL fold metallo-hydrolase [Proteobacteria bacterium]|nr:MBL fold metallo-hydrolase [Pseudomonadota bacterium]